MLHMGEHGFLEFIDQGQAMFDGSVSIISSNPEYATQIVSVEQTPDIRIAGKVVYMIAGRRV